MIVDRFFFDHPAVLKYKWYWRVEPGISFTCAITYDPFVEMERRGKTYGYTIALWELGRTVPSLFRKVSGYKARLQIPTSKFWIAMASDVEVETYYATNFLRNIH